MTWSAPRAKLFALTGMDMAATILHSDALCVTRLKFVGEVMFCFTLWLGVYWYVPAFLRCIIFTIGVFSQAFRLPGTRPRKKHPSAPKCRPEQENCETKTCQ